MKKYLRLYANFFRISLRSQMTYKTNFLLSVVVEFFWVWSHLLYILAIWQIGISFPGFGKESMLVFVGTYLCLTGVLMGLFYTNFINITSYIHDGQLDLYLVKPVSSQFILSLQRIDFGYPIPDILIGMILLAIGWQQAGIPYTVSAVGGYTLFFFMSIIWLYCFQMVPVLLSFIFVKTNGVFEVFYGLHDLNKVPMGIYNNILKCFGTFILPIFPMVNFPPMWAMGNLDLGMAVYGVVMPIVLFLLIRFWWKASLRKYSSANG